MESEVGSIELDPNLDCLTTDPHSQQLEPFVFLHIPKTAGSIVRLIVHSLFDASRIFPGSNYEDYSDDEFGERLRSESYGVFVGHLTWSTVEEIATAAGRTPNVLTALREPFSHSRSQLAFASKLMADGSRSWTKISQEMRRDPVRFWSRDRRGEYGADLAATQILFLLGRSLAADLIDALDSADSQVRYEKLQCVHAVLLQRLESALAVVFFEDLRRSVDLFSARFSLPRLEIPSMRLNASGAEHTGTQKRNQVDRVAVWQSLPSDFDALARKQYEKEYAETFDGIENISAYLNASYREAVFACMPHYRSVSLSAENAWPGYGWSLRLENNQGQAWRTIGTTGRSHLFVRLHQREYILSLKFHSVPSIEAVDQLRITANGIPIIPGNSGFSDGYFLKHFFVPSSCFVKSGGEIELGFFAEKGNCSTICFSGISVHPS